MQEKSNFQSYLLNSVENKRRKWKATNDNKFYKLLNWKTGNRVKQKTIGKVVSYAFSTFYMHVIYIF